MTFHNLFTFIPFGFISWDPERIAFTIPYFNIAIMWYGIFFALGFVAAYFIFISTATRYCTSANVTVYKFADTLLWYILLGTLIGARLGHVLFYDLDYYLANPIEIIMIRNGGLASHGGSAGVLLALFLFVKFNKKRFPNLTYLALIDLIAIPTPLVGCFIRIGNFFNQEIVGTATNFPLAIIFQHPAEPVLPIQRHPAQLYEAFAYLLIFIVLYAVWNVKRENVKPGTLSGLLFILVFGARFLIEFVKIPQDAHQMIAHLQTGQILSLPFILLGILLLFWPSKKFMQDID